MANPVDAAIEQGRYIALDAAETLSAIMVNDLPDLTQNPKTEPKESRVILGRTVLERRKDVTRKSRSWRCYSRGKRGRRWRIFAAR